MAWLVANTKAVVPLTACAGGRLFFILAFFLGGGGWFKVGHANGSLITLM